MRRSRHHRIGSTARAAGPALRRGLVTLAALFAVFLQTFVVQTHVDGLAAPVAQIAATADAQRAVHAVATVPTTQTPCLICEELAVAGRTLLAETPLLASDVAAMGLDAPTRVRRVPEPPAHAWQSRAPPLHL